MCRGACVVAALATLTACGARAPAAPDLPSISPPQTPVEVRDSSVDALPDSRIPTSPDIVLATVDVRADDIVFGLRHRPGTFDPANTRFAIDLDIDQDASTGTSGVEYHVFIFPAGARRADVARTSATSYTVVGSVPVSFVADGCDVAVPLSLLGNDDRRFDFRVRVYAEPALPLVIDSLPDVGYARVR